LRVAYMVDLRQAKRDGKIRRRREEGTLKERWGDEEGAESSLHVRLKVCKERWRDENAAEWQ